MNVFIHKETDSDIQVLQVLFEITKAAFENHPHSAGTEPFIVGALRAANALTISPVAEVDGKVAGHAVYSPVTMPDSSPD
jgi:putative acetyltransferase